MNLIEKLFFTIYAIHTKADGLSYFKIHDPTIHHPTMHDSYIIYAFILMPWTDWREDNRTMSHRIPLS